MEKVNMSNVLQILTDYLNEQPVQTQEELMQILRNGTLPEKCLDPEDVEGEVVDFVIHHLQQRHFPDSLAIILAKLVAEKLVLDVKSNSFSGQGDQGIESGQLHAECLDHLQNLCKLWCECPEKVPTVPLPVHTVSTYAIKNGRRKMEDRHIVLPDLNYVAGLKDAPPHSYYAVFDGHAGLEAANYATAHLHFNIATNPAFINNPEVAMKEGFLKTDKNFLERSSKEGMKSGCTAVCCLLRERTLYIGWLGDSQAILVKHGESINLVSPHKPDREDERQRIEELGGCVIFMGTWRVNGTLAVSRALGDPEHKPYVSSVPDIVKVDLDGTEDFLVIACDGLWDRLTSRDVISLVYSAVMEDPDSAEFVAQTLVEQAKEQGSSDNITTIVVFLRDPRTFNTIDVKPSNNFTQSLSEANPFSNSSCNPFSSDLSNEWGFKSNDFDGSTRPSFQGHIPEATSLSELPTPPIDEFIASNKFSHEGEPESVVQVASEIVHDAIENAVSKVDSSPTLEEIPVEESRPDAVLSAQDFVEQLHQLHSESRNKYMFDSESEVASSNPFSNVDSETEKFTDHGFQSEDYSNTHLTKNSCVGEYPDNLLDESPGLLEQPLADDKVEPPLSEPTQEGEIMSIKPEELVSIDLSSPDYRESAPPASQSLQPESVPPAPEVSDSDQIDSLMPQSSHPELADQFNLDQQEMLSLLPESLQPDILSSPASHNVDLKETEAFELPAAEDDNIVSPVREEVHTESVPRFEAFSTEGSAQLTPEVTHEPVSIEPPSEFAKVNSLKDEMSEEFKPMLVECFLPKGALETGTAFMSESGSSAYAEELSWKPDSGTVSIEESPEQREHEGTITLTSFPESTPELSSMVYNVTPSLTETSHELPEVQIPSFKIPEENTLASEPVFGESAIELTTQEPLISEELANQKVSPEVPSQFNTEPEVPSQFNTEPEVHSQFNTEPEVHSQFNTEPEVHSQFNTEPEVCSPFNTEPEVNISGINPLESFEKFESDFVQEINKTEESKNEDAVVKENLNSQELHQPSQLVKNLLQADATFEQPSVQEVSQNQLPKTLEELMKPDENEGKSATNGPSEEQPAAAVELGKIPESVPEAEGVTEDSDSEKDGGWSFVKPCTEKKDEKADKPPEKEKSQPTSAPSKQPVASKTAPAKGTQKTPAASAKTKGPDSAADSPKTATAKRTAQPPFKKAAPTASSVAKKPLASTLPKKTGASSSTLPARLPAAKSTGSKSETLAKRPLDTVRRPGPKQASEPSSKAPPSRLTDASAKTATQRKPLTSTTTRPTGASAAPKPAKPAAASAPARPAVSTTRPRPATSKVSANSTSTQSTTATDVKKPLPRVPSTTPRVPSTSRSPVKKAADTGAVSKTSRPLASPRPDSKLSKDSTNKQISGTRKPEIRPTPSTARTAATRPGAQSVKKVGSPATSKTQPSKTKAPVEKPTEIKEQNGVCEEKGTLEENVKEDPVMENGSAVVTTNDLVQVDSLEG